MKIRYYLPLLLFFTVSCTSGEPADKPAVNVTQRWLSTNCPPQEACAPDSGLEAIAQAYLEALILGDCDQAADYWLPERIDRAGEHCTSGRLLPELQDDSCQLVEFSSRDTRVEQLGEGKSVHMSGEYLFECDQESTSYEVEDLILFFEERDGEWYIAGFNS